jgi:hypothetical protein
MTKILTHYDCKPIPIRWLDWTAHYDGGDPEQYGSGRTRGEAIQDLIDNYPQD